MTHDLRIPTREEAMRLAVQEHMVAIITLLHEAGNPPSFVTLVTRQYENDSINGMLFISDDPEPEKAVALMLQIIERNVQAAHDSQ